MLAANLSASTVCIPRPSAAACNAFRGFPSRYGPNEAGKSCALAGVTDLLFGIEGRTSYDFLHEGKTMRISAEVESRDGTPLAFKRRKGTKNTLLATGGDTPLADDALAPFLGGLTREVFCRAFGLNAKSLREFAREMLNSEGEVGATLLAAAAGLRGLTELRRALETEAKGIFDKTKSKDRRFYQALERVEMATRNIRDLQLRAERWKELNDHIAHLESRLKQIDGERGARAAEQARLNRLKKLRPLMALMDQDRLDCGLGRTARRAARLCRAPAGGVGCCGGDPSGVDAHECRV